MIEFGVFNETDIIRIIEVFFIFFIVFVAFRHYKDTGSVDYLIFGISWLAAWIFILILAVTPWLIEWNVFLDTILVIVVPTTSFTTFILFSRFRSNAYSKWFIVIIPLYLYIIFSWLLVEVFVFHYNIIDIASIPPIIIEIWLLPESLRFLHPQGGSGFWNPVFGRAIALYALYVVFKLRPMVIDFKRAHDVLTAVRVIMATFFISSILLFSQAYIDYQALTGLSGENILFIRLGLDFAGVIGWFVIAVFFPEFLIVTQHQLVRAKKLYHAKVEKPSYKHLSSNRIANYLEQIPQDLLQEIQTQKSSLTE